MFLTGRALARRTFLRGLRTAAALPFLDSMVPALAQAQRRRPDRIGGVSLSKELARLGLTLERRRTPVEMLVIDRLSRTPTEN